MFQFSEEHIVLKENKMRKGRKNRCNGKIIVNVEKLSKSHRSSEGFQN